MQCLDLTLPTIAENLALDEALLLEADAGRGRDVLRFWEWTTPAVVLGSGCQVVQDVDEARCQADGVPILRRSSGGGTVLLGAGCLCFSLVLPYDRSPLLREIPFSYIYILDIVREAVADLVPAIRRAGTSDLAAGSLKFSGNAQQRKRHFLLHHGTLLCNFDLKRVGDYLGIPIRQPEYRHARDHASFLCNLPTDAADLKRRLRQAWGAISELTGWPRAAVQRLVEEKYSKSEWVNRR
jgi:lipoate-protein ligase A